MGKVMAQKQFKKKTTVAAAPPPAQPAASAGGLGYRGRSKEPAGAPRTSSTPQPAPLQEVAKRRPPEPKPERKADELPIVSVLPRSQMDTAISLMTEDITLAELISNANDRRKEIKAELAPILQEHDLPGLRHGQMALYFGGEKTKWSLDRKLLLENGVTPQQIQDSMKESKPFIDLRITDLSKPRKQHAADED